MSNSHNTRKGVLKYLVIFYLFLSILLLTTYVLAPAGNVCSSASPCSCGTTCQNGGSETGYATIDGCQDGFDHSLEYVHDINVSAVSGSSYNGGETVTITGIVKCSAYGDHISFAYHNGTSWKNVYAPSALCNNPDNYQRYYKNITLDNVGGTHTVRVIINYLGGTGLTCGYSADQSYSDTDDISFTVIASAGPEMIIDSLNYPANGTAKKTTLNDFNFTALTNNRIENCSLWNNQSSWSAKKTIYNVLNNTVTNFTMNMSEGAYKWNVYCYDNESNYDWYDINYTSYIDLTEPGISINSPQNMSYLNSTTLFVNVSHRDVNPNRLILNVDGSNVTIKAYSGTSTIINRTGLSEGAHNFTVYANDTAGNTNVSESRTIYIDTTTPSAFDLVSPANYSQGTSASGLSPLFNWSSTNETNFNNYTLQISTNSNFAIINYTKYTFSSANSSFQFDETLPNNRTWYWRVLAYDKAGNYRQSSRNFTYITNTSDISVSLNNPIDNYASMTATISFSYTPGGTSLSSCSLYGNFSGIWQKNQTNSSVIAGQPHTFSPINLTDGKYIWNVECNKTDGSSIFSIKNYTLYVDTISPSISFTSPTPINNSNQSQTLITINVTHSEINPASLILSWNGTNQTYYYSGIYTNITKTGLEDGTYSYYIWVSDTAGNYNQTEIRTITIDSTPPAISSVNVTPSFGNNLTIFNITAIITDNFPITAIAQTVSPDGTVNLHSMAGSNNVWAYEFNSSIEGVFNATIIANDSLDNSGSSELVRFIIDLTPPGYYAITEQEDPLSGDTSQVIRINVSDALTNVESVLISYEGLNHSMALESGNRYNYTWDITTLGIKYYSFFMNDSIGNWNYTQTFNFTINDSTPPNFRNITYTPAALDDIDPNIPINISTNISDRYGISTVILQYRQINESDWANATMANVSSLFVGNFTPNAENNWTFRIWANDSSGNYNVSANLSVGVYYDWSWNRTPSTFTPKGSQPSQLVSLGVISIANTGDYDMQFDLSNPADQPTVGYNESEPFTIPAKTTKQISATAVAPALNGEYPIDITIDAVNISASPTSLLTSTTIVVSSASTEDIFVYIYEYDSSVEQGQTGINLTARIMNLGGVAANNITSNWTLPSDFITRDDKGKTIQSIASGESEYHTIIVSVSPEAALTSSAQIKIEANSTSGSYSSDTKYVSINEPGTSSIPSAPSPGGGSTGTPAASGGGGGGATIREYRTPDFKLSINAPDQLEIMRGTTQSFFVDISNEKIGTVLSDIKLDIQGFKPGYIRVQPDLKTSVIYRDFKRFKVIVEVPKYMRESRYSLDISVSALASDAASDTANKIEKTLQQTKKISLIIHEVGEEDISCLQNLENSLTEMENNDFNTAPIKKILAEAKRAKESKDYKKVIDLCSDMENLRQNAYDAYAKILAIKESINASKEKGIDVSAAERMLKLAEDAFKRGNFDRAIERLREAELSIQVQKAIEAPRMISTLLKDYWVVLLVVLLLLSGSGIVVYRATETRRMANSLQDLKKEEEAIMDSIKQIQTNYFVDRIISTDLYRSYMEKFSKKMAGVQHKIIELKLKEITLRKKNSAESLKEQSEELLKLIGELQRNYYERKIIDRDSYKKMFYEFKRRYVDVSKQLSVTIEKKEEKKAMEKLAITDPRQYFYLHNGKDLKSIKELLMALRDMDDETFKYHVNNEKNDFYKWIRDVFENKELADEISKEKTKEDIINILDIYLSKF